MIEMKIMFFLSPTCLIDFLAFLTIDRIFQPKSDGDYLIHQM